MWAVLSTKVLLYIVAAVLIAFDIYLASDKTPGNTYSEVIRNWAVINPLLPYAFGVLGGHFFLLRDSALFGQPNSVVLLGWTGIVFLMVGIAFRGFGLVMPAWIPLVLGVVAGHYLWPQHIG